MRDDDRVHYTLYITTLETEQKGTLVGRVDQHPAQLVSEHYGDPAGLLPWGKDGYEYLVVLPATEQAHYLLIQREGRRLSVPFEIVSRQRVIDYVRSMTQERVK